MHRRFFVSVAICLDANTEKLEHSTRLQRWEFHNVRPRYPDKRNAGPRRRDHTRFRIAGLQMSVRSPAATSRPCRSRWVLALYPGTDMIVFFEVAMHGPLMPAPRRVRWSTRPSSRIWIIPGACFVQRDG